MLIEVIRFILIYVHTVFCHATETFLKGQLLWGLALFIRMIGMVSALIVWLEVNIDTIIAYA